MHPGTSRTVIAVLRLQVLETESAQTLEAKAALEEAHREMDRLRRDLQDQLRSMQVWRCDGVVKHNKGLAEQRLLQRQRPSIVLYTLHSQPCQYHSAKHQVFRHHQLLPICNTEPVLGQEQRLLQLQQSP
jgi:hypothetical protein